jgi:putative restriction endonuclease
VAGRSWSEAVATAIRRHVLRTGSTIFDRQTLIDTEGPQILAETGSGGTTPWQTLSRVLQELRDEGSLEFVGAGTYRYDGLSALPAQPRTTKGVFVTGPYSDYGDDPPHFYRFPAQWLNAAQRVIDNWIIYQEPRRAGGRGYFAVGKVQSIVPDPKQKGMFLALIEPGTFLEFGRDVPFQLDGRAVERGLLDANGRLNNGRAVQSIRPISNADFNRIVELGLMDAAPEMPRVGQLEPVPSMLGEAGQEAFQGPVDRATILVNRKFRDARFRRAVLHVYEGRCALTGMRLVNGGGRLETEAAHIMSVGDGGPDAVNNGIALSGTVHWMFDRGLIGLSDSGDILLSSKINDRESVEKMIYPDRRARWPSVPAHRPHSRYLA